jgi:hypothetical protein
VQQDRRRCHPPQQLTSNSVFMQASSSSLASRSNRNSHVSRHTHAQDVSLLSASSDLCAKE